MGDYLHLTRQHWISSLSLILPGNDDDNHLQTATRQTALQRLAVTCGPAWASGSAQILEAAAAEMALRIHLT